MRLCIEMMSQFVLLGISCVLFVEIIMINMYIQEGRNYLHQSVDRIECSDNRTETAKECAAQAKEKGYILTWDEIKDTTKEGSLLLTLRYDLNLFDKEFYKGEVQAYAR